MMSLHWEPCSDGNQCKMTVMDHSVRKSIHSLFVALSILRYSPSHNLHLTTSWLRLIIPPATVSPPMHARTPYCVPYSGSDRSPSYPAIEASFTPGWDPNTQTAPTPVCQEPTFMWNSSFARNVHSCSTTWSQFAPHATSRGYPSSRPMWFSRRERRN